MILVAISKLLIPAVEAISFEWVPRRTTQVDDGMQQRFDFTSTFGSGKKKKS